jgi:hypothetical protein
VLGFRKLGDVIAGRGIRAQPSLDSIGRDGSALVAAAGKGAVTCPLKRGTVSRWVTLGAVGVNRVSHKDASAKQTQNCRDCFNHFDAPLIYY